MVRHDKEIRRIHCVGDHFRAGRHTGGVIVAEWLLKAECRVCSSPDELRRGGSGCGVSGLDYDREDERGISKQCRR